MSHFLVGERIALRALESADADGPYPSWFNDAEVVRSNSHGVFPYDRELALAYVASVRGSRSELVLAIEMLADRKHVGNVALQSIHPIYRSAELSLVIGERDAWGKGIGEEASRLIVRHGFAALGLHRVGCGTLADNEGMKRLALKLGMREEGRRRHAAWKRGAWIDIVEYGILADEFERAAS